MIDKLQEYIRDEVPTKLAKAEKKNESVAMLDKAMFFGDFVDDSKTFSISWGERE